MKLAPLSGRHRIGNRPIKVEAFSGASEPRAEIPSAARDLGFGVSIGNRPIEVE